MALGTVIDDETGGVLDGPDVMMGSWNDFTPGQISRVEPEGRDPQNRNLPFITINEQTVSGWNPVRYYLRDDAIAPPPGSTDGFLSDWVWDWRTGTWYRDWDRINIVSVATLGVIGANVTAGVLGGGAGAVGGGAAAGGGGGAAATIGAVSTAAAAATRAAGTILGRNTGAPTTAAVAPPPLGSGGWTLSTVEWFTLALVAGVFLLHPSK